MLCLKKIITGFGILFLVFVPVFFSSSSYAIDDISVTYNLTDSITSRSPVFPDCDSNCLKSYNFLKAELDNPGGSYNNSINIDLYLNEYYYFRLAFTRSSIVVSNFPKTSVTQSLTFFNNTPFSQILNSTFEPKPTKITFTLMESLSPDSPSGSISITENGSYDVTQYAEAVVNVPIPDPEVIPGEYHDDLVSINNSILIAAAVILVIYFFYCIYRMIIKSTGGKE